MEGVVALLLIATIKKLVDFVRVAKGGDLNGIVTQLVAWFAGIGLTLLVAQTAFADGISFGGVTLAGAGFATAVVIGLAFGSAASLTKDVFKAIDRNQTEDNPPMVGPAS